MGIYTRKERLNILYQMMMNSEKAIDIYHRLPQDQENKVEIYLSFYSHRLVLFCCALLDILTVTPTDVRPGNWPVT